MSCSSIVELPRALPGKTGWPWTEESPRLTYRMRDGSSWPRISVVTPSLNQGQFLEESIRSVLLQDYPNLEYVIIDGGSIDGSVKIIRKYEPWLAYWLSEPDKGQSHAINKGFKQCTGDIITFLGSDDIYLPGTFRDVGLRWGEIQEYGAIVGAFNYIDERSKVDAGPIPATLPGEGPVDLSLGPPGTYRLHQVSTFYVRKALDDVGRYVREDLKYTMDRELLYRVCRKYRILLVDKPYGGFRRHKESKSISRILPFAKEFSELYLLFRNENEKENRKRRMMARYRKASGYLKYAKTVSGRFYSSGALLKALLYRPAFIFDESYIIAWLDGLRVRSYVNALRQVLDRIRLVNLP